MNKYENKKIEIINEIFESDVMRNYLKENIRFIDKNKMIKIIASAPIDIHKKAEMFSGLYEFDKNDHLCSESKNSYYYNFKKVKKAIHNLNNINNAIYVVNSCWTDFENKDPNSKLLFIFPTFEKTVKGIEKEMESEGWTNEDSDVPCWYEIIKFTLQNGYYEKIIKYIYVKGKIMFFSFCDKENENIFDYDFLPNPNLNLITPFKTGDIVSINCQPFKNNKNVLILENQNNQDCCSLQALWINSNNNLEIGAVKHSHIYENYHWIFSPLFRIDTTKSIDQEDILIKVKKYIGNDLNKSKKIWDIIENESSSFNGTDISAFKKYGININ